MAVPPIQPTRAVAAGPAGLVRALRVSPMLDVVLGLLVAMTLPLAIVAIPNTISVVAALLPPDVSQIAMIRAHGLALPAMVLTVPVAVVVLRRMRAAPMVVAGLALLAFADAAGGYAGSPVPVGALRVLHGVGAGLLVPATLMAVWGRSPLLRAVWGASLAAALLAAQALALWPLDQVDSWRVTLQPYPLLTGAALALAALYLVLWLREGEGAVPEPVLAGSGRTLWTMAPAAGVAALAVGSTFDWPAGLVVLAALGSVLSLLALASWGASKGAVQRAPAYAMIAVGVVLLPTAAQTTYVELGGLGGPGLSGLWPAFAIAAAAGLVSAALVNRSGDPAMPVLTAGGLGVLVAGLCAVRLFLPASAGFSLILPFVLLAVGASVALTAALRCCDEGAALSALSLFFPAVLAGFLLGSGVQVTRLEPVLKETSTPQALVDGFVDALHLWALIGGGLVLAVIVLGAVLGRLRPGAPTDPPGSAATGVASPTGPTAGLVPSPAGEADPMGGGWPGAMASGPVGTASGAMSSGAMAAAGGGAGADGSGRARPRHEPDRDPSRDPARDPARDPGREAEGDPGREPDPERVATPPVVVPPPAPSPEDGPGNGQTLR
ncbi:hypothetical protein [Streptosporangium sp. NPDC023615]|uniref:hypothetical protein n=1 Tax=Streptosporangium sp. NPDC023615 TaxID=3154794 RepID=UPI003431127F